MTHLIDYAKSFLGIPYIWAGEHPSLGYDCSGLVQAILQGVGIDPLGDQTAQALYDHMILNGSASEPQAGALCFYGRDVRSITHVNFMISENLVIEAGGGCSKCVNVQAAIQEGAFVRMRPHDYRRDLVAVVLPKYPMWVFKN